MQAREDDTLSTRDAQDLQQGQADELAAWHEICAAAPAAWAEAQGFSWSRQRDALAVSLRSLPVGMFNRAFGWPQDEPMRPEDIDWALRAVPHHAPWLQPTPGPAESGSFEVLRARGFELRPQRWAKLAKSLDGDALVTPANDKVKVRELAPDEGTLFGTTLQQAYGLPPFMAAWTSCLAGRPGWHLYTAEDTAGAVIGCAALFMNGGSGWLGMAATLPAARNQGAQRSLMWRRLADAQQRGARLATTETGEPLPGQPSPSFHNMLGCGFRVCGYRTNWSRANASASNS